MTPVTAEQAPGFGILQVNAQGRITHFEEKPGPERLPELVSEVPGLGPAYLASMGIYLFGRERPRDVHRRRRASWTSAGT